MQSLRRLRRIVFPLTEFDSFHHLLLTYGFNRGQLVWFLTMEKTYRIYTCVDFLPTKLL